MPTPLAQLESWLAAPEGARLEFKAATGGFDSGKLARYCVALANEGGGRIVLGVSDRRPREVVGTQAFPEPGRTEALLHQKLAHRISVEELAHPQGRVVVVHVPPRLPGVPWQLDGAYWARSGDELRAMRQEELRAIFAEGEPDFSDQLCPGASLADLAPQAIATFRDAWAKRSADPRKSHWSDAETLHHAELMEGDTPTYAALILFGTHAALGKHLAQAEVLFEYRLNEAAGPAHERVQHREGWFLFHEAIWQRIQLRNERHSYQQGLFRFDLPSFEESSVREALLNAITHRDYRDQGSVWVRQYPQRLEFVSPGGLPSGITPENILDQQKPRNRRLAEALERCGMVERAGQGMNLIFERAIRTGKGLPQLGASDPYRVQLVLEGALKHPDLVRFLEQVGAERMQAFTTHDFVLLDALQREQAVPERLKHRLPALMEAGVVESIGRGKGTQYLLTRALQAAMGQPGAYTRKKGLDHETNKALLLKHLKNQGWVGAPMAEFQQVLPALHRNAIRRMLGELEAEGLAQLGGEKRGAKWYAPEFMHQVGFSGA